jgi:hypothetical protein
MRQTTEERDVRCVMLEPALPLGTLLATFLTMLCFAVLVLAACSEEPERPDQGETDAVAHRTAPDRTAPQTTVASGGYVEHTVGSMTLREEEGVLTIEEAELYAGEKGRDEIVVQATIRGQSVIRDCFLMEGPARFAMKRAIERGEGSDTPRRTDFESSWADPLSSDEFFADDTYVKVFFEDTEPEGEVADPRQTPFFALCYKDGDSGGTGRPTIWYDVAHVEGTPEAR